MLVAALAAVKLILHLYAGRYYGYFVDELYNLALARHLDWGYVDVAPMIALIGRIELTLLGESLSAIRLASASRSRNRSKNCCRPRKRRTQTLEDDVLVIAAIS